MIYQWAKGSHIGVGKDPARVKAELDQIGESLEAEQVVAYASNHKKGELHKCFEWDDKKAGHQYRLDQAREIVRSILIVPDIQPPEKVIGKVAEQSMPVASSDQPSPGVRAYFHTSLEGERKYRPLDEVLNNDNLLRQVLKEISSGVAALERKAKSLNWLRSNTIDGVMGKLSEVRLILESDPILSQERMPTVPHEESTAAQV